MKQSIYLEEKYHNSVARFYSERRLRDYIWEVPEEMYLLDRHLFKPNTKVVDMGCGPAVSVSRTLGKQILNNIFYTGVDISRNLIKFAKRSIPNGKFIHDDMSSVRLPNGHFDILISLGALHHCENKKLTLRKWINYVKPGGLLLLREPIYEYLKKGTGESPIEEGIRVKELLDFVAANRLRVIKLTYFSTNAFHLFNRFMIKLGLESWQQARLLWYPIVSIDAFMSRFKSVSRFFDPQAFAIIIQKT